MRRQLALLLAWLCLVPPPGNAQSLRFGVFGDMPYGRFEREQLPRLIAAMDAEDLAFVVHVGDFKDGSSPCSDELYLDRLRAFEASSHPLVFVPGDNDWTDCHRGGQDPLERLQRLRELFFQAPTALGGRALALERQSTDPAYAAYRENARWQLGEVLFLTLNIPGSDNNFRPGRGPGAEFVARSAANGRWLAGSFARAREAGMAGIVVFVQANPDFESAAAGYARRGYRAFLEQLTRETIAFPGQVLLIHGDTHAQRVDRPMRHPRTGARVENFLRLETYGSPFLGWVAVSVEPGGLPLFRIDPRPYLPQRSD